jgi:hypothetical protein
VDGILRTEGIPNPHHVLNTSPDKHQVIWSVEGFSPEQAEELVRAMAQSFGADQAVWDVARVLRMPGFRNWKYELPHYVKDIHENPGEHIYRPGDFPTHQKDHPAVVLNDPQKRNTQTGHVSQSERDWAFARRALERGDLPSTVQARIEQFRQDKPNPRYYAQRTVRRALMAGAGSGNRTVFTESNALEPGTTER